MFWTASSDKVPQILDAAHLSGTSYDTFRRRLQTPDRRRPQIVKHFPSAPCAIDLRLYAFNCVMYGHVWP